MSSRYPNPERSPSRLERRGSVPYSVSRNPDTSHRSNEPYSYSNNQRELTREPPIGPKAAREGGRGGSFPLRGRGYGGRGDPRDVQFGRRESERDWRNREPYDRRVSPVSRARSRSPVGRDFRDGRDFAASRDLDLSRAARGTRDGPLSAASTTSESPYPVGASHPRGGSYRGRGPGEFDARGRGRGTFTEDREGFRQRSRSRERVWDREFREDRSRAYERDAPRQDEDKRSDWDQESDRYKRDPPTRSESRNSGGSYTNPSTPLSAIPSTSQTNPDRFKEGTKHPSLISDGSRRSSFVKDDPRQYQSPVRHDFARSSTHQHVPSSPPQPTPVPAFGSMNPRMNAPVPSPSSIQPSSKDEQPTSASPVHDVDPIRVAPKGPKADLNQANMRPKSGPSFPRPPIASIAASPRLYDGHQESQTAQSPSASRFGGPARPVSSHAPIAPNQPRAFNNQWTSSQIASRINQSALGVATQVTAGSDPSTRPSQGDTNPPSASVAGFTRKPPTGPKVQPSIRAPMVHRGGYQRGASWTSNVPRAPSIMNSNMPPTLIPKKRDVSGEERTSQLRARSLDQETQMSPREPSASNSDGLTGEGGGPDEANSVDGNERDVPFTRSVSGSATRPTLASPSVPDDNLSDEGDYDDNMDLDEEDFEGAEKIFRKELENLEAKRPPSPKHHPEMLVLLEELDALASAAEDLKNGYIPPPIEAAEMPPTDASIGLPSPVSRVAEGRKELEDAVKLETASASADLPLDGLPYLVSGIPTPLSEAASVQENNEHYKIINAQVMEKLVKEKEEQEREDDEARREYAQLYRVWRSKVEELERDKRDVEEKRAVTPVPLVIPDPSPAPTPIPEGGRRNRAFGTELDLQQALAASKITAEEEFNREREAQENDEKPDMTKEAVIPEMLSKSETSATFFKDTNNFIENDLVLDTFGFVPPEDDFTPEEQHKFIEGYIATPKKWGHIALNIKGRDYQDCIRHYYLTKRDTPYKLELNRVTGRRRGRGGARGRPRNTGGLLGSLDNRGTDYYAQQVPITDAGRPRRLAAPTSFNEKDKKDNDAAATPKASVRGKGAASLKATGDVPEAGMEKVAAKRGRQAQPKEKAPKRGKAQQLLAPNPSPAKEKTEGERARSKEPKTEDALRARDIEGAQMLAGLHSSQPAPAPSTAVPQAGHTEAWLFPSQAQAPVPTPELRAAQVPQQPPKEQPMKEQPAVVPAPQVPMPPTANAQPPAAPTIPKPQTSSYWSVPEQTEFQILLGHYGTDWQSIASTLKTKSHVMVKNYFHRQIVDKPGLELLARDVDEKLKRQGPPGTPPVTNFTTRRRNDSSAPSAPQRTLAPNPEAPDAESEAVQPGPTSAPSQASPSQYGQHQTRLVPLRQAGPPPVALPAQVATAQEPAPPSSRQQVQIQRPTTQQIQGPRIGFFNDGEHSAHPTQASAPVAIPRREIREHQPIEREQAASSQVLGKEQFTNMLSMQHARKEESKQQKPQYPAPNPQRAPIQQQPVAQKQEPFPQSRAHSSIMPQAEADRVPRVSTYQSQRPPEPSPPVIRRQESYPAAAVYSQPSSHSPIHPRPSPQHTQTEVSRPGSVPISTLAAPVAPSQPPPPPQPPAPAKRSNIMSILNDEPAEPQPLKTPIDTRTHIEARPPPPPPPHHHSPATQAPLYQQPAQQTQYQRRDPIMDGMSQHQSTSLRPSYSQQLYQSQPQQQTAPPQSQPPPQAKEPSGWSTSRPSFYEQRHVYGQSTASSPQTQQTYLQPARPSYPAQVSSHQDSQAPNSRHSYSQQTTHMESQATSPHTHAHSRGSSYSTIHPQVSQGTGQSLAPSPWSSIRPPSQPQPLQPHPPPPPPAQQGLHQSISHSHSHSNSHSHSQPVVPHPSQQRSAPSFPMSSMQSQQQQQQHDHPSRRQDDWNPRMEAADRLRAEQDMRSQDMRAQDMRAQDLGRHDMRAPSQGHRDDLRREAERRESEIRQQQQQQQHQGDEMKMYTPPIYGRQAYQPPPPPPLPLPPQSGGGGSERRYERTRYEERR